VVGSEGDSVYNPTDPVNLSLPRPVDNGIGWKTLASLNFPEISNGDTGAKTVYDMTVTYFAVCI
jgi:hypothetical protein